MDTNNTPENKDEHAPLITPKVMRLLLGEYQVFLSLGKVGGQEQPLSPKRYKIVTIKNESGIPDDDKPHPLLITLTNPENEEPAVAESNTPPSSKKSLYYLEDQLSQIQSAFERGDEDVFCTLTQILETETLLDNVTCLPRDPPILRMPYLVMDKIFKYLEPKDILSLRLTSSVFPRTYAPLQRFLEIPTVEVKSTTKHLFLINRKDWKGRPRHHRHYLHYTQNIIPPFVKELLRSTTKHLILRVWSLWNDTEPQVLREIIQIYASLENLDLEVMNSWGWKGRQGAIPLRLNETIICYHIISASKGTLKRIKLSLHVNWGFDLALISKCQNLEVFELSFLAEGGSCLGNLESLANLKGSLHTFKITGLDNPMDEDQISWMYQNLEKLKDFSATKWEPCKKVSSPPPPSLPSPRDATVPVDPSLNACIYIMVVIICIGVIMLLIF